MNGFTVQWSDSVRHIGNFVDSTLSDQHLLYLQYLDDVGLTRWITDTNDHVNLVIYNHIYC